MRIVRSTFRKIARRPASWVTAGLIAGLLLLVYLGVGATVQTLPATGPRAAARPGLLLLLTFPRAYDGIATQLLDLGGLFGLAYAAAVAGSEWGWGTLKAAVARGESRSRYMLGTLAALIVAAGLAMLVVFAIGVAAAVAGATLAGVSLAGLGDGPTIGNLPNVLLHVWLGMAEEIAVGFAVATLTRSQLAGVGAGLALFFGEQFATLVLPDVVKYLPFNAASAVISSASLAAANGEAPTSLPPDQATVVTAIWLVAAMLLVAGATERAEIGS